MSTLHTLQRLLLVLLLAAAAPAMSAAPFEPQIGQEGKDVIWVPTPTALIEKMLDAAKVTANDYVIDLGSGDGRTVIAAAKRGARALGDTTVVDCTGPEPVVVRQGRGDAAPFLQQD